MAVLFNTINQAFNLALGAHAATTRLTYTVPAGKRSEVNFTSISILEPAGHAAYDAAILVAVNGIFILSIYAIGAVGQRYDEINNTLDLKAAEVLTIVTVNNPAVNTNFLGGWNIREYQ